MKSYIKAAGLTIILLFLVTFGIKNNHNIQLNYYLEYRSIEFPLYLLAYGCTVLGIFVGMLIGITHRFHQRKKVKVLTKLNNDLKAKIEKETAKEVKPEEQKSLDAPPEDKAEDKTEADGPEKDTDKTQKIT
jgi:uncharacterized integral membrane protein